MTTIIINERTKKRRIILNLVRELSCGKILDDNKLKFPNSKTLKAIREAQEGKIVQCADFDDYIKKVQ